MMRGAPPRWPLLLSLVLLSACAIGLLAFKMWRVGTPTNYFLAWNLFLAWVPLPFALAAEALWSRGHRAWSLPLLAGWLLFFPNAPYLATDLLHLGNLSDPARIPLWYDLLLLLAFAVNGLLLGFASLALVHGLATRALGAGGGWCAAAACMLLSGFGIYLGRFLRWNSWDLVTQPRLLLGDITGILSQPRANLTAVAVTLALGVMLLLAYYVALNLPAPRRPQAP